MTSVGGGCQCGAVRYRINPPAPVTYVCHCRECQKQSASAFGMSLSVPCAQVSVTGALASWERATDVGSRTRCFFCPACGSRVYHVSSALPDRMTIKGGSMDDTSGLVPTAHIWTSRKQAWVRLDPDVPTHETQPEDLAGWRSGLAEAGR